MRFRIGVIGDSKSNRGSLIALKSSIGCILGLYRDSEKENGNYYRGYEVHTRVIGDSR